MNRELVTAAACAVATIALAWIVDHPDKVGGSVFVLAIIAATARFRGDSSGHSSKWKRRRHSSPPRT